MVDLGENGSVIPKPKGKRQSGLKCTLNFQIGLYMLRILVILAEMVGFETTIPVQRFFEFQLIGAVAWRVVAKREFRAGASCFALGDADRAQRRSLAMMRATQSPLRRSYEGTSKRLLRTILVQS